ncbi:MAG: type I restriction endonuclease [Propionivibrio sp.]
MITEDHIEDLCITGFQETGWEFRHGPDIAPDSETPERTDYRQVLLPTQLREALRRLNPDVPDAVLDEVLHHIAKPDHPSLIQSNRAFHETLIDGVPVEVDGEGGGAGDFGWPACPCRFADSQLIKKIAGYHQFHAVREAVRATVTAATMPALPEDNRVEEAAGDLRQAGRGAQGRHRLAHPRVRQEYFHGVFCRQADAAAGDAEPDAGRGHRPQRPGRPVVPDLCWGAGAVEGGATAGS